MGGYDSTVVKRHIGQKPLVTAQNTPVDQGW